MRREPQRAATLIADKGVAAAAIDGFLGEPISRPGNEYIKKKQELVKKETRVSGINGRRTRYTSINPNPFFRFKFLKNRFYVSKSNLNHFFKIWI